MKRPRNRMAQPRTRVLEEPLQTRQVEVPVIQHRAPCCGAWVSFRPYATRGAISYVECPACGKRHALNLETQTIRRVLPKGEESR